MIKPFLQDEAFLADVRQALGTGDEFHLWWLGQSGFLVQWGDHHLLFDPYLSDSLTHKYAATDKPHTQMTEQVVAPGRLDFIDVVTSSHNHTDHLDRKTLEALMQVNPELEILVPSANQEFAAERLAVAPGRLQAIDAGESIDIAGFTIYGVPAAHEKLETDSAGRQHYLGYLARFGPWTVYHSGDTILYEGMMEMLRQWRIDLALLPINGRKPERRVAGNLFGREAARLAKDIGARLVVPCHFEMFEFNTESPDEFVNVCRELNQPCHVLRAGERWTSDGLGVA